MQVVACLSLAAVSIEAAPKVPSGIAEMNGHKWGFAGRLEQAGLPAAYALATSTVLAESIRTYFNLFWAVYEFSKILRFQANNAIF